MTHRIRAATDDDLRHLYEMAKLTGGGFTNLPPDKPALKAKLDRSHAAFARTEGPITDELFVLILENAETGEVAATCEFVGVHLDRKARKSAPFAPAIRNAALRHLDPVEPELVEAT